MQKPIDESPKFQVLEQRFEYLGRFLLFGLIGAGALGAFGNGPFSETRQSLAWGDIEYSHFGRSRSELEYTLHLKEASSPLRIAFADDFLNKVELVTVSPDAEIISEGSRKSLLFPKAGGEGVTVRIVVEPKELGLQHPEIILDESRRVRLTQLIYP